MRRSCQRGFNITNGRTLPGLPGPIRIVVRGREVLCWANTSSERPAGIIGGPFHSGVHHPENGIADFFDDVALECRHGCAISKTRNISSVCHPIFINIASLNKIHKVELQLLTCGILKKVMLHNSLRDSRPPRHVQPGGNRT